MARIGIVGTGYVGLATAITFGIRGHDIICGDIDTRKIDSINKGSSPVQEEGFEEKLGTLTAVGRLKATSDIVSLVNGSEYIFICVDTPMAEDGSMDLSAVEDVLTAISPQIAEHQVIIKSTVIPGTTEMLSEKHGIPICHNPEFLREGKALFDSENPDRIIIGCRKPEDGRRLAKLFEGFRCPVVVTDTPTSEMIKYANNIFLATKISYANEMANICELFGVDVYDVMDVVKMDKRISPHFLEAGAGFGGSCFPKDLNALLKAAGDAGYDARIIRSVLETNEAQPLRVVELLEKELGDLDGQRIAILGLAFKENSDDVRNSRAIPMVQTLIHKGVELIMYDPEATDNFKALGFDELAYAHGIEYALRDADGAIIQTKWPEISDMEPDVLVNLMRTPVVIDGRRALNPEKMLRGGVRYRGIGWKNKDF